MVRSNLWLFVGHVKDKATAKELWDELKTAYGSTSGMGAFSFFKAAIGIRIPQNEHPAAAISKIIGNLDELESTGIKIPTTLRALMILGAAPARYNAAVQATLNAYELKEITTQNAHDALVASWESSKNSGQSSAQKISAIKQRKGNPSFSQQQRPSGSSSAGQKDGDDKGKGKATEGGFMPRGKRGGKNRGKAHKKHHHNAAEMHIADMASIPAPSTSTIAEFGPSGSKTRKVAASDPKGKKRARESVWFRGAGQLAKDLDVSGTAERLRKLDQVAETTHIEEVESDDSRASKRSKVDIVDQYKRIMEDDEYITGEDDISSDDNDNFEDAQEPTSWAEEVNNDIAMAVGLEDDPVQNRNPDGTLKCLTDLYPDPDDDWEYRQATNFLPRRRTNSAFTAASNPPNGARTL